MRRGEPQVTAMTDTASIMPLVATLHPFFVHYQPSGGARRI